MKSEQGDVELAGARHLNEADSDSAAKVQASQERRGIMRFLIFCAILASLMVFFGMG
jgi:hypothetical protein